MFMLFNKTKPGKPSILPDTQIAVTGQSLIINRGYRHRILPPGGRYTIQLHDRLLLRATCRNRISIYAYFWGFAERMQDNLSTGKVYNGL